MKDHGQDGGQDQEGCEEISLGAWQVARAQRHAIGQIKLTSISFLVRREPGR